MNSMLGRLALTLLALLLSTQADALLFRAYLASDGSDFNPCTLPAPCRLLPAALTAVADGGEIWMLDSANYNTLTVVVTKSVTILAIPGAVGSVVAAGGPAFIVSSPGLDITLRNLVIRPLPPSFASFGVYLNAASTVTIENSVISQTPSSAIYAFGSGAIVKLIGSTLKSSADYGIVLQNGAFGEIQGTKFLGNASGAIQAISTSASTTIANVSDCLISGGTEGVFAYANTVDSLARVVLTRSTISNVQYALDAETIGAGSAAVVVSYSTIANSFRGFNQAGAGSVIFTLGNNHIANNAGNSGSLTAYPLQ